MTEQDADQLKAWVAQMTTEQVRLLWKWLFLELIARWRRGEGIYREAEEGR